MKKDQFAPVRSKGDRMTVSSDVLRTAQSIAGQSDFRSMELHQIGNTPFYLASNSSYKHQGHEERGKLTLQYGGGVVEYPIVFIPRMC